MDNRAYRYHMSVDLEKHLENLAENYPEVKELHSLWLLLRKRLEEALTHCGSIFVNYSLHDGSHSRNVIQAVEQFLGKERICQLSATDTFMLLVCIYSHDYGMSQTFNKVYDILGSAKFKIFLENSAKNGQWMEKEDEQAINHLLQYLNEEKTNISLKDLYYSIMLVVQLYLRPEHWKGVLDIKHDFEGLFQEHLKKRFIWGMEGITEICMSHGQPIEHVFKLSYCADGMVGDKYHPRFIASMLRLGDSLDLDNGRFPMWFVREAAQNRNIIPKLSLLHFRKHEAISHLLITPEAIEITAHCVSEQPDENKETPQKRELQEERARQESYKVASLVYEWTDRLSKECRNLVMNWGLIAQPDFGNPPASPRVVIYVDEEEYIAENRRFQMRMSHDRVMMLLEGTAIYKEKYRGIREILQNAIDASLLQLWSDLLQNRYSSYGLSKNLVKEGVDLWDIREGHWKSVFGNYDITVEVIEDRLRDQVILVVKDKGISITKEELQYIAEIGTGKEKNERIRRIMESMPAWLKPAGAFGIGLQSVFQITDCIEFYSRQYNAPEQHIILNSYRKNRGKIECWEIPQNGGETYYDNATPGTNVKIVIDSDKFLGKEFRYFDPEFNTGEKLHMLYMEVAQTCRDKIRETKYDYFNVYFQSMIIMEDGTKKTDTVNPKCLRSSYIYPKNFQKGYFGEHLQSFAAVTKEPYAFSENRAYFWDRETKRCYLLKVNRCQIIGNTVSLPERIPTVYSISYKFNNISDTETVYARRGRPKSLHTGFLSMNVLILDDQPEKYLNIDRGRLREGAIDEEELIAVQRAIMRRWCIEFCKRAEKGPAEMKKKNEPFAHMKGILISLILLFYRNVPDDLFQRFMRIYKEVVDSWDLHLETDEIPVSALWDPNHLFQTQMDVPTKFIKESSKSEELLAELPKKHKIFAISMENIQRLPHRIIKIESIMRKENKICYDIRLQSIRQTIESIDMSEEACLYDYMGSFDFQDNNPEKIKFDTLPKKVYKPDSRFENLLLYCFPRTFRKGRNMNEYLDHCIKTYILSPIDREAAIILGKGMDERRDVWPKFRNCVIRSDQLQKCVAYIMKKRYGDCENKIEKEQEIRQDYERFLEQFYRILTEHNELVMKQFEVK